VHLLSLCGCSDFPCANCPNGLVRDDDAAVLNILSQFPCARHLDDGRQTSSLRVRVVLRRPGAVLRRLVACAPLLAPRAFHLRREELGARHRVPPGSSLQQSQTFLRRESDVRNDLSSPVFQKDQRPVRSGANGTDQG
jgi:hypothetical protein